MWKKSNAIEIRRIIVFVCGRASMVLLVQIFHFYFGNCFVIPNGNLWFLLNISISVIHIKYHRFASYLLRLIFYLHIFPYYNNLKVVRLTNFVGRTIFTRNICWMIIFPPAIFFFFIFHRVFHSIWTLTMWKKFPI